MQTEPSLKGILLSKVEYGIIFLIWHHLEKKIAIGTKVWAQRDKEKEPYLMVLSGINNGDIPIAIMRINDDYSVIPLSDAYFSPSDQPSDYKWCVGYEPKIGCGYVFTTGTYLDAHVHPQSGTCLVDLHHNKLVNKPPENEYYCFDSWSVVWLKPNRTPIELVKQPLQRAFLQ